MYIISYHLLNFSMNTKIRRIYYLMNSGVKHILCEALVQNYVQVENQRNKTIRKM